MLLLKINKIFVLHFVFHFKPYTVVTNFESFDDDIFISIR